MEQILTEVRLFAVTLAILGLATVAVDHGWVGNRDARINRPDTVQLVKGVADTGG